MHVYIYLSISIRKKESMYAHLHTIYDLCNKWIITNLSNGVQWLDF